MAMKFQYDEQGDSFVYFVLAVLLLFFLPSTYLFWPRPEKKESDQHGFKCACDNCEHKRSKIRANQPRRTLRRNLLRVGLILGWMIIIFISYKVATTVREPVQEFDPYAIMEIDRGASTEEIKKKYRQLSRIYHPDRQGGNETRFIAITKAHAALTDDTARENWEKYGNPDGPGLTTFGIALPVWLVQGKNSLWVLGLYGLVFMIILPTAVGVWWYRSIRYTSEAVLIETTKLVKYFFHRSSNINVKRILLILSGAYEYEKKFNPEIVQRPDDNIYIPQLMKTLGTVQEKIKEQPFGAPYSVKARALLLAHMDRVELPDRTLREDLDYILKKTPVLIAEMISSCSQLMGWYYARQIPSMPSLETVENVMKLSQMLVQGLNEHQSPLLQIPNVDEDILRHFFVKKRNIKSIAQFLQFPTDERRKLLRSLTDKQYGDVISVCHAMPHVELIAKLKVVDDVDEQTVTAGAIVTVDVKLIRHNLGDWAESEAALKDKESEEKEERMLLESSAKAGSSKSAYRKNKKKTKGKKVQPTRQQKKKGQGDAKDNNNGNGMTVSGEQKSSKGDDNTESESSLDSGSESENDKENHEKTTAAAAAAAEDRQVVLKRGKDKEDEEEEESDNGASDEDGGHSSSKEDDEVKEGGRGGGEDDEWAMDLLEDHEAVPEAKSRLSHPVHCPYFPEEKQEWWWVFLADKKNHRIVSPPVLVTNLVQEESTQLKFTAQMPGTYNYTVIVKSDSYLDSDTQASLRFEVKEAKEVDMNNPQWEMPESDEEKEKSEGDDYASETDESDEDSD